MKTLQRLFLTLAAVLLLAQAPHAAQPQKARAQAPELFQAGVIDALLAGGYDGFLTLSELARAGNFGLGTFHTLDGEMVVLDGVVYQVPADGRVRKADLRGGTPFAQVVPFRPGKGVALAPGAGLKDVEQALDAQLGDPNVFAAARVEATFATLTARSVPAQKPPYRPLAEVAKEQSVFPFANAAGTLVGLRGPAFAKGMGVPGWHWHFLTRDRDRGGHVMDFRLSEGGGRAGLMAIRGFRLALPKGGMPGLDLARDRSDELKAVETGK